MTQIIKYIDGPERVFQFSVPAAQQQNPSMYHKPANTNKTTFQKYILITMRTVKVKLKNLISSHIRTF